MDGEEKQRQAANLSLSEADRFSFPHFNF